MINRERIVQTFKDALSDMDRTEKIKYLKSMGVCLEKPEINIRSPRRNKTLKKINSGRFAKSHVTCTVTEKNGQKEICVSVPADSAKTIGGNLDKKIVYGRKKSNKLKKAD